jgi:hypothetical protein
MYEARNIKRRDDTSPNMPGTVKPKVNARTASGNPQIHVKKYINSPAPDPAA